MRLRKECEHGRFEYHTDPNYGPSCPGGEFLPEGALWYCMTHRAAESAEEGTCEVAGVLWNLGKGPLSDCNIVKGLVVLDALASQVGESE